MSTGWIKLSRDMCAHWLWTGEFSRGQAWIDLLLHASHSDNQKMIIKGEVITWSRGQQIRSVKTLQKAWGWSRSKVNRFLDLLEKDGMIKREGGHLTTTISICNYESFQGLRASLDTSLDTSDGHLTDISRATNKNVNNGKNEKKEIIKPFVQKFSTSHMEFAKGMYSLILNVAEKTKEPNFEKWADEIRLMNQVDGYDLDEMSKVFTWANKDSFWKTNILSPSKFRKQYSSLHSKMKATSFTKESKVMDRNIEIAQRFLNS